jgi:hypothetical protein
MEKSQRRISITAFRRQISIYSGEQIPPGPEVHSSSSDASLPNDNAAPTTTPSLAEGQSRSDLASVDELTLLAQTLIQRESAGQVALKQVDSCRRGFWSRIPNLGRAIRQLKTRLNISRQVSSRRVKGSAAKTDLE